MLSDLNNQTNNKKRNKLDKSFLEEETSNLTTVEELLLVLTSTELHSFVSSCQARRAP
jgi:hypothetical protein